jgi:hypothetical protein
MKKHLFLVAILMVFTIADVAAQHYQKWVWFKRKQYLSIGASLNAMSYFGDVTPKQNFTSLDIRYTKPSISVFVQKRLKPHFTVRGMLTWGRIEGDDNTADPKDWDNQYRYVRNLHFVNDIWELSVSGILDFVGNRGVFYQRPSKIIPYLTFGVAAFYHNPQAYAPAKDQVGRSTGVGGELVDLQPLGTEGQGRPGFGSTYSRFQIAFPVGLGIRYKINPKIDIGLEIAYRFTTTDYLDDVSGNYTDLGVFGQDALARSLHDRSLEEGRTPLQGVIVGESSILRTNTYYTNPAARQEYADANGLVIDNVQYPTLDGFGNPKYNNIRGNNTDNDVYIVTAFSLTYIIPGQVRCPEPFKKRFRRHRL